MLGNVQAINAGGFGGFHKLQPLVKKLGQRPLAVFDMIKQSDLHDAFHSASISRAQHSRALQTGAFVSVEFVTR
jgi:hypothetical protein